MLKSINPAGSLGSCGCSAPRPSRMQPWDGFRFTNLSGMPSRRRVIGTVGGLLPKHGRGPNHKPGGVGPRRDRGLITEGDLLDLDQEQRPRQVPPGWGKIIAGGAVAYAVLEALR